MILELTKRNIKTFFRDKMNVFFALLSSLILFVLYSFFLGNLQVDSIKEMHGSFSDQNIRSFVNAWVFAGILTITTVTSSLAALTVYIGDATSGRLKDFMVSPVPQLKIVISYFLSTFYISLLLTAVVLAISQLYIVAVGGELLSIANLLEVCGYLILSCSVFAALSSLVVTFIRSQAAFTSLSVIVGTSAGFLAAVYVPIGTLPQGVANFINALPFAQIASLIRMPFTNQALSGLTSGNVSANETIRTTYGLSVKVGDTKLSMTAICLLLLSVGLISILLAAMRVSKKLHK